MPTTVRRSRPRLTAAVLGLLTAVATLVVTGPGLETRAEAAVPTGADVSWPNCPVGLGTPERPTKGEPMPADDAAFVVLGLTNGPAFTPNPCLRSQVAWAALRRTPTSAYAVTSYPTAAQLAAYGGTGTLTERLYRVGVAQATDNLATMRAAGLRSPIVWTDIEPVAGYPFSSAANNNALVDGLLAGYSAGGVRSGFYSYASGWSGILGSRRTTLPVWATAGKAPRSSAQSRCSTASFSGGPVQLSQWYDDHHDWDLTCPGVSTTDPGLFVVPDMAVSAGTVRYVQQVYRDVLGRESEPSGASGWAQGIANGHSRREVADAITASPEFRGGLVDQEYLRYLGRPAETAGRDAWVRAMSAGATIEQLQAGIASSPEAYASAGGTSRAWVERLYVTVLSRPADQAGLDAWTAVAASDRYGVALGLVRSTEHLDGVVDSYYGSLLHRPADLDGRNGWVGALQSGLRLEQLVGGLVASDEYYASATAG